MQNKYANNDVTLGALGPFHKNEGVIWLLWTKL